MPVDYSKMKIAELKAALEAKGLPVVGKKQDLVDRLKASEEDGDDDILDQDDSMTAEAIKLAEEELSKSDAVKSPPAKLKRVPIASPDKPDANVDASPKVIKLKNGKENEPDKVSNPTKVQIPKPTAEDLEAKIKSRAERFGGFQSDEAKKAARAAKFGSMLGKSSPSSQAPALDIDVLKKRAGRFGTAISPALKTAEVSEAIKRRQERFGVVSPDEPKPKMVTLNSGVNSVIMDEKMKKRLERFKEVK